ncbi:MAG TPA: PQQ-binding-like beta-propeller repeat protein, partial [Pirellulaceae bacterium]|nr:PQQ-binding-like beta-propeller repeat protein [Pirellulaceae bacterium]
MNEEPGAGEKLNAGEKRIDDELPSADERPSEAQAPTAKEQATETKRSSATESSPSTAVRTADWPQFGGGPSRNAVAPDAGVPIAFDLAKGTGILWKARLGNESFGSPVVAGGKVLIGTNNGGARVARHPKEIDLACLLCFDEPTGRFLWQYASEKLPSGRVHDWPQIGLCSTPCVVGDRVYFMSNRCEVVCIDLNGFHDGENDGVVKDEPSTSKDEADVVWRCDLFNSLGVRPQNQAASSATVVDGLVLLNTSNGVAEDHRKVPAPNAPSFIAVDSESGRVVWSDASPGGNILPTCPSSSPAVARIGGVWQAIFAGGDGWLYAFDLDAMRL